jgi:DNA-binding MarR family transcriptional regulator
MKLEEELKTNKFKNQVHKATLNLLFTSYWLRTKMSNYLKIFGVTSEQFNVMRILKGKHPEKMCVKDIGSRMIEKNSNVPRILDRLVRKNIVVRQQSSTDKRETECQLTEEGLELLSKINTYLDLREETVMNLDEETAEQLNNILEKIREV